MSFNAKRREDRAMETITTPAARNTDPITSHMAALEITARGTRGRQQRLVLRIVIANPGKTSRELSDICALDRYQVARRLPELEAAGVIEKGPIRRCTIGGRHSVTWWGRNK